jgi:peptidoglycan/LPS O-acetylase OafA/YrhL
MAAAAPAKIPELTGIRGVAALWVFVFHVWLVAGSPALTAGGLDLTPLLACGWAGVDLFFVLSGFALTWPQAERHPADLGYLEFMRRRALRVVPAYYTQLLLLLLLAAFGLIAELPSLGSTLAHLLFLHNLDPHWSSQLSNTWWTLPIEWQFYLLFPLLLTALVRYGALRVLPALVLVMLAWRIGAFQWLQANHPAAPVDYRVWLIEQLPGRIDQFFVGMAAALLTRRLWTDLDPDRRQQFSSLLLLAGAALTGVLIFILWPRAEAYWQGHWLLYVWHLLAALPLAALIGGAALHGRPARALLGNRPVLWLGEISYSIYLWNYVVLLALVRVGAFNSLQGPDRILWVGLYSLLPVLAVSAASWWLAERPFLHYRDAAPDRSVGRYLAAAIRVPWRAVAAAGLVVLAVLGAARWYWTPRGEALAQCTERGALDSPRTVEADDMVRVIGWSHDWNRSDRVRRIVARVGDRVVGEAIPTVARPDVVAALPLCRVGIPGFELGIPIGGQTGLAGSRADIVVEAERSSGRRYPLGRIAWQFGPPKLSLDRAATVHPDDEQHLLGWAWHPDGPVKLRWLMAGRLLAETQASGSRDDVAQAFPHWPGANRSGFSLRLPPAEFPRGNHATTVEAIAADGTTREMPGPTLENDRPIGRVLTDGPRRWLDPASIPVSAWLYDEDGIAEATVETELGQSLGRLHRVKDSQPLPDLFTDPRGVPPGEFWQQALRRGSLFSAAIPGQAVPAGIQRLVLRVRDHQGRESILPGPLVGRDLPPLPTGCPTERFTVYLWATTQMLRSGLPDLAELRRFAEGGCVRFGLHARVEYLRTTRGRAADFEFDPDFPEARRFHAGKEMTTTSLREALAMADRYRVPMRILLDGGVWADSHFALPEYDITDWLEQDDRHVQWNQHGKTEADDALQGLAGGHDNPQLGRVLTLNIYNQDYRHYKRRNLQAAIRLITEHNLKHPDRPVSVTFDPDLYINPWFYLKQWYDYNPDTLRQFQEWLTHRGPYVDGGELAGLGRRERLDLAAINRLAGADWQRLEQVDPPRDRPDYSSPWHQTWTAFKRHLVGRHYADLARWAREAGLAPEHIFTAQTFIQADVSVTGDDPATGWVDEAGVSIAGAKPADGHLGAILYGPASRNRGRPRSGDSLFANIRSADPGWEVAEMNPANIERPDLLPSHLEAYQTIREIYNHGAGAISPMWNGMAGDRSVRPGQFKSYETFGQSPFETQLLLFLREAASLPRNSLLWTFGNDFVASDDGFEPLPGSRLEALPGRIRVHADGSGSCGIRGRTTWTVPPAATTSVAGSALGESRMRLLFEDGTATDAILEDPTRSVATALGHQVGKRVLELELHFRSCPAELERIVLTHP